jgi:hypothetical protein
LRLTRMLGTLLELDRLRPKGGDIFADQLR